MNRKERRAATAKNAPVGARPAVEPALKEGVRHHQAGRLQQAEQCYRAALQQQPDTPIAQGHTDALHLLGVVLMQRGQLDEAVELISRAVRRNPSNATYLSNHGIAHIERGETDDAIRLLREALRIDPDYVDARYNLGNALRQSGAVDEALEQYLIVSERHPADALARNNAAICLIELEKWEPAIEHLKAALGADPSFADAHANLAMALFSLDRFDEAEHHSRQALKLAPEQAAALVCLGNILRAREDYEPAVECFRRAADADPDYGAAFNNLGNALAALGRYDEALTALRRATELASDPANALSSTGKVLKAQGRLDEAIEFYDASLAHHPDHLDARFGRAIAQLVQGRFAEGWSDYLTRESMAGFPDTFDRDRIPADLSGTNCLVERDQGLGDEIFFLRFVSSLRNRGAHVAYRPDPRLAAMLRRANIADDIVEGEAPADGWDRRIAAGDLPYVLDVGGDPPPSIRLEPLPKLARETAERLAAFGPPPYIGLTWRAGSRGVDRTLFKNAPLDQFAHALRHLPGTIVALQRAPEADEIDQLAAALGHSLLDMTELHSDLEAMLALVGALDEYVAVSNTNVHLRAAVDRESRVLVPNPPEFRWMNRGAQSPWFPGTTVYRQDIAGNWASALDQLRADLIERHGAI